MREPAFLLLLSCVVAVMGWSIDSAGAEAFVVRVPSSKSATLLQEAIDACRAKGGGTVVLESGTHLLDAPLRFHNAANITLIGQGQVRLVMAPQLMLTAAEAAEAGHTVIVLEPNVAPANVSNLEAQAPGRVDTTPKTGRRRQIPYFSVAGKRVAGKQVEGNRLILDKPPAYPVPKGTKIISAYNAIQITGTSRNLSFEHLTIDGNRAAWPLRPLNHSRHCGIFIAGAYSYETGPAAEPVKGIAIDDCTVRGFHHRGIALYSTIDSRVSDCRIEETGGEGIDLDHFVYRCRVIGCRVRGAPVGVELNDASHCAVTGTVIEDCPVGIRLWRWCTLDGLNTGNVFADNTILRAAKDGIQLAKGTSNSRVINNSLQDCGTGIRLECNDSVVQDNRVRDCKEAIAAAGEGNRVIEPGAK